MENEIELKVCPYIKDGGIYNPDICTATLENCNELRAALAYYREHKYRRCENCKHGNIIITNDFNELSIMVCERTQQRVPKKLYCAYWTEETK